MNPRGRILVRASCAAWLIGLMIVLPASAASAADPAFDLAALDSTVSPPGLSDITDGALASRFQSFDASSPPAAPGRHWIRFTPRQAIAPAGLPVFVVHLARTSSVEVMTSTGAPLALAMEIPAFRGTHELVYALNGGLPAGDPLYLKVEARGRGITEMRLTASTLQFMLARGEEHARMVALSVGALTAVSVAALLIWLVLADRLFVLYGSLFFLQALYLVYLTGQGFAWPWLAKALPLGSHAWNVPAGLSGAISCLFVREIADLKSIWPRVYAIFGGLAVAFVVLTVANLGKAVGLITLVNGVGNLIFLGTAIFTLVVALVAWRRGSRAAGWFLFAWTLLETCAIATTVSLLIGASEHDSELLYYYALPLSMVAAAVLIALGVADRLREQRLALSDAERRAQTDALTGVLNRRSLIERLEAAGVRARARGLPIAVLFIDLDHFKLINDSYGHRAGDACLRAIIGPIQAELRQSDVIGRYGGEEFVVMLSSADAAAARPIAERIRSRVEDVVVDGFGAPIRMTCSIGLAASDTEGLWGELLIARADEAVYAAKHSGRNQVRMVEVVAA
jgi:diguanylate cyclase (GGDEF)-like protein